MGLVQSVSDILATLANRFHGWDQLDLIEQGWLEALERDMEDEMRAGSVPELDLSRAITAAMRLLALTDTDTVLTFDLFQEVVAVIHALDRWHAPLGTADRWTAQLSDEQEDALRCLSREGAFNSDQTQGALIPPAVIADRAPTSSEAGLIAQLLHDTAYLPPFMSAGHPDSSDLPSTRTVALRYVNSSARLGGSRRSLETHPVVAIAPVIQALSDARLDVDDTDKTYVVSVNYDPARLEEIVYRAIAAGAHLLLMPEMAVNADHADALASSIRRAVDRYYEATGEDPELLYVMAGLSYPGGGNSILVLDIEGFVILEQHKLCRWNLTPRHQHMFCVKPGCADNEPELRERIPGGDTVWIADLEELGRFLTLICADMDYDKPGHWIIQNVAIDWLHAPIMDKSMAWWVEGGKLKPWIVERAYKATTLGVAKVVVTNSVLLTLLWDESSTDPRSTHKPMVDCAISLMMDRTNAPLTYRQIDIDLPPTGLILESFKWGDGFAAFPPPGVVLSGADLP